MRNHSSSLSQCRNQVRHKLNLYNLITIIDSNDDDRTDAEKVIEIELMRAQLAVKELLLENSRLRKIQGPNQQIIVQQQQYIEQLQSVSVRFI